MQYGLKIMSMILVAFTPIFSGCVGNAKPPDPIYFYTVDYASPGPVLAPPVPAVIRVERFSTSPPYNSQRMVYTDNGPHRNTYAYHQWIAAPGDLLPFLFARDLEFSGGFQAVFPPDTAVRTTHSVHGWIEQFLEQDGPERWIASAIVHITLMDNDTSDPTRRIMLQRRYASDVPAAAKTPAALARAMGDALSQISKSMCADIYTTLSGVEAKNAS